MKIKNLFERDIFRPINGVVKADQLDESSVWQELDEFVITNMVSGSTITLPLFIWAKLRVGVTPDVNAVCTVILVSLTVLSVLAFGVVALASRARDSASKSGLGWLQ